MISSSAALAGRLFECNEADPKFGGTVPQIAGSNRRDVGHPRSSSS